MNATQLAKELNRRGNMTFLDSGEKMLQKDIRQLWMIGVIDGDKPSHNCLGRTIFKLKDVNFRVGECESQILCFIKNKADNKEKQNG